MGFPFCDSTPINFKGKQINQFPSARTLPRRGSAQPLLPGSAPGPRSRGHLPGAPQPRDGFAVPACGFLEQKGRVRVCRGTPREPVRSGHRAPRVSPRCPPAGGGPGRGVGGGSPRPLITPVHAAGERRPPRTRCPGTSTHPTARREWPRNRAENTGGGALGGKRAREEARGL